MNSDVMLLALAKVVKDKPAKTARDQVEIGKYPVDFNVRIHGVVNVGKDTETPVLATIDYKRAFRIAMKALQVRANLCDSAFGEAILSVMELALNTSQAKDPSCDLALAVDEIETRLQTIIGWNKKRGSVTTQLDYTLNVV